MRRPLLFFCVCLFVLTALGMQITNAPPWNSSLAVFGGEEVLLTGQVYKKEYSISNGEEILILYLQSLENLSDSYPIERVICEFNLSSLPKEEGEVYLPGLGEEITIRGTWQEFSHATNPGEFDYADYYAIEGIEGKLKEAELLAGSKKYWYVREALFECRQRLLKNLYTAFEQRDASILAKMLLGDGSGLDAEVRELYQDNGIVHILSISGLHISLIGMGIYKLLRKGSCPVGVAAVLGGLFLVLYGFMTGFGVSACRAIGMYLIHMLGELWGKTYDMLTAMGVLAVIMVFQNPRLVYHSGYLLSFASVCGMGLLSPVLKKDLGTLEERPYEKGYLRWCKKSLTKTRNGFAASLSVTLFTLPLQLFFYYKIPVYSVFLNLPVLPFMSVVMIVGFLVMLFPSLTFLCPVEGFIFDWFEWLCNAFQKLPGHTWVTGRPKMWKILVYYVVLLMLICFGKKRKKAVRRGVLLLLVVFVGLRGCRQAQISFLDVGQGDCVCVCTAEGECYLFDGGSSSRSGVGEKVIVPFLQYYGISRVDGIFISHADTDHVNGLLELLQGEDIQVERLILPQVADAQEEFEEVLAATGEETIIEYVAKGAVMESETCRITCLHPAADSVPEGNEYSACFLLEMEERKVLLTGDVEGEGEASLIEELNVRGIEEIDVLKVAHHGSKNATSEEFLEMLEVKLAVISCGKNNIYGHPHEETLKRLAMEGCSVYITAEKGAVTFLLE